MLLLQACSAMSGFSVSIEDSNSGSLALDLPGQSLSLSHTSNSGLFLDINDSLATDEILEGWVFGSQ